MSTGTSQTSLTAHPVPKSRRAAVVVGITASLAVLGTLGFVYASMSVNGADLGDPRGWILVLVVAMVPGFLVAWAVSLGLAAAGRRPPSLALLVPVTVLLMVAAVAGMTALADRTYDTEQTNIATACTRTRVAVLEQFREYRGVDFFAPYGDKDGTCSIGLIYPSEDAQAVMATVVTKITADGWATKDKAWDRKIFTRNGQSVLVTPLWSEVGQTNIRVTAVGR